MKEIKRLIEVVTIIVKDVISIFKGEHKEEKNKKNEDNKIDANDIDDMKE